MSVDKEGGASFSDCVFQNNGFDAAPDPDVTVTQTGGAIALHVAVSDQSIVRCRICNNKASAYGGGVSVRPAYEATVTIDSCLIADNSAGDQGGGIDSSTLVGVGGLLRVLNCTVANNHAEDWGGGLWSWYLRRVDLHNSIFWGNTITQAQDQGPQFAVVLYPDPDWREVADLRFSDVEDGLLGVYVDPWSEFDWAFTNIEADPLFVDPENGDYHLLATPTPSPCIDSGDNALILANADLDRGPRIENCTVDRGAYEYGLDRIVAPQHEPVPSKKNRYISVFPGNPGKQTAIRVKLLSMHHPETPPTPQDFSRFEGQVRWVGEPVHSLRVGSPSPNGERPAPGRERFAAARLQCTPYYRDWTTVGEEKLLRCAQGPNANATCLTDSDCASSPGTCVGGTDPGADLIHVTGGEIVPDSTYEIRLLKQGSEAECDDLLDAALTGPILVQTSRWGDIATPFHTAGNSQPNALDITASVNSFKSLPGSPSRVHTQLLFQFGVGGSTNALDISAAVDAFKGFVYPYTVLTNTGAEYCPCTDEADIRADLDGDGDIDSDDNALEATEVLYFVVNSDDDNGNDVEDYLDDGPVDNEDDLVELRLGSRCPALDPGTAWWSISWTEPDPPNPALKVWATPDKSDGQGGTGTPIANNVQQDWPPPTSLWLEAMSAYDDITVTLTTPDSSVGAAVAGAIEKIDSVGTMVTCTPGKERYYVRLPNIAYAAVTGAEADIDTSSLEPLCGEFVVPHRHTALSAVWVGVSTAVIPSLGYHIWVQLGYAREFQEGTSVRSGRYVEARWGPDMVNDRLIEVQANPDPGSHNYVVWMPVPEVTTWVFQYDDEIVETFDHPVWAGPGDQAQAAVELFNKEDRLAGLSTNPCKFTNIKKHLTWHNPVPFESVDADLKYDPESPGWLEWGKRWIATDAFEVWDLYPD